MHDPKLLDLIDLYGDVRTIQFRFPLDAQCPYRDETDRHIVQVWVRGIDRQDRFSTSVEAGSIERYAASWADEKVSVEALAWQVRDDFVASLPRGMPVSVDVDVTTHLPGVTIEARA
jgi:hypothetical protein